MMIAFCSASHGVLCDVASEWFVPQYSPHSCTTQTPCITQPLLGVYVPTSSFTRYIRAQQHVNSSKSQFRRLWTILAHP